MQDLIIDEMIILKLMYKIVC